MAPRKGKRDALAALGKKVGFKVAILGSEVEALKLLRDGSLTGFADEAAQIIFLLFMCSALLFDGFFLWRIAKDWSKT